MRYPAVLALADGSVFHGESIGIGGQSVGEVVFNTAMSGYQEILSDPSYARQLVTLTYPHIGNTGTNAGDNESDRVHAAGLIIRDMPILMSNWRAEETLETWLEKNQLVAISGIDTRRLTRILREKGAQSGCIMAQEYPDIKLEEEAAIAAAREFAGLQGMDLAKQVSTETPYDWQQTVWQLEGNAAGEAQPEKYHVVAYDFGVKHNILRLLVDRGCKVSVVPAQTPASEVLAMQPDGVFLSNGPGDPEPCDYAVESIQTLLAAKMPMFGICLGHQLLSLACGAQTLKMKFGHHGANHPVQDLDSKQVMITSQNHGFAVDENSLPETLRPTHRSLFDGSLQGVEHTSVPAFGFQGHPEASPGPHDVVGLFDRFVQLMDGKAEAE
ncbi:glutamine-hydrolyzing carbamoyl-phosphate synthase small subunit [Candidatus Venteria ishoeyi]|uniref:Carbamoyl phosphate synthase small chain n=1 Tax=Candidatus Venteria ishoeyi TaxID=1899563 RepID=A0A1H6FIY6_9GAMM|nr:glutamine-hydrolyzing carbamoyl-phosphate synthase small subunit [Candidatus Venteria ishoeyi]SEH09204.1 Carbamoyl-phosphate synthase small chain [Candidatus Venteria ishoeyi]SEH09329.1 Carbamoyl-phosphate synthase small chain [Candidatus Venteria ishoeyi]